ncbi:MAG: deoxyribodipyrimidine photo-lyase [Labilithrix sp.]
MRTLVWFRGKDLRVSDHWPLVDAAKAGEVIPLFVVDPYFFSPERAAELPHRMQFLVESLLELAESIEALGSRLVFVRGKAIEVVPELARKWKVDRVVAHRWTEPVGRKRDEIVTKALGDIPFELHEGETLAAPHQVMTGAGTPFSVFGPYSRAFAKAVTVEKPRRAPRALPPHPHKSEKAPSLAEIGIEPNSRLTPGGEKAAHARLRKFVSGPGGQYEVGRDLMGEEGTSRLSQDLKFGVLTPRQVWHAVEDGLAEHPRARKTYLNELVWRELAYHVLFHHPQVLETTFRDKWSKFPWKKDEKGWQAWVDGTTGYPVVDASARQLLATGFVHNRARMISASFLTKHLLIDYRRGEAHYLKFLTDGDWASNNLGWQWSAGCGVDAQPWFRVFNPILQGEKFDPEGTYVKTWLPELRDVPKKLIHKPYKKPVVEHEFARNRFLAVAKGHLG